MAAFTLQTNGSVCPFPLIDAKNAMEQLATGDDLIIDFDCTQATDSLPQWAGAHFHADGVVHLWMAWSLRLQ